MKTTFTEFLENIKDPFQFKIEIMGQELNREIVDTLKDIVDKDLRKELNKDRIKALGLKLIQGGKSESE